MRVVEPSGIGAVLVIGTIALSPTDHGGVSLTLFVWLIAASGILLARQAPSTER